MKETWFWILKLERFLHQSHFSEIFEITEVNWSKEKQQNQTKSLPLYTYLPYRVFLREEFVYKTEDSKCFAFNFFSVKRAFFADSSWTVN